MSDESTTNLKKIDNALSAIEETDKQLTEIVQSGLLGSVKEILDQTKKALMKLDEEKHQLQVEKDKLENQTQELQKAKKHLEDERSSLEEEKNQLEIETKKLEKEKAERDDKIDKMSADQIKLLDEYEILKKDLKKLQDMASEAENQEFDFREIQTVLKIYMVLLEEIYGAQPHIRILYLLHGDKEKMHKDDIKNSLGIGGAFILRSLHDLKNANLIEFDEETGIAKLINRMIPKTSKDLDIKPAFEKEK